MHRNWNLDLGEVVPSDTNGDYYVSDLIAGDLNTLPSKTASFDIDYPIQTSTGLSPDHQKSYAQTGRLYYGIQTTKTTTEKRSPESVEIIGDYFKPNKTSQIKVINKQVEPSLNPYLNAGVGQFLSTTTLITDDEQLQSITGIKEYHDAIVGINNYEQTDPTEQISFSIIGEGTGLTQFSQNVISPQSGLTSFSVSLDEGDSTQM